MKISNSNNNKSKKKSQAIVKLEYVEEKYTAIEKGYLPEEDCY